MHPLVSRILCTLLLALFALPAWAHKASDAYLQLAQTAQGASLRVDVALRDLDAVLDLDADGDARLTWAEIRQARPAIERYVRERVGVQGCAFSVDAHALEQRSDGAYAVLRMTSPCTLPVAPVVRYTLLAEVDATHRGLLKVDAAGGGSAVQVLDPGQAPQAIRQAGPGVAEPRQVTGSFVAEGMRHILGGYDHVLFLLCLMLPAVMRRDAGGWRPVRGLREALLPIVGIVTAFTVAHSITLALAATRTLLLPARLIEPAIAVTIVLAAIDNLWPIFRGRRGVVTLAFGLIHGFGFADALAELSLPPLQFAFALLKFNIGLELGQLLIVVLSVGLLYAARRRPGYPSLAIRGGSVFAIGVGVAWLIERTVDVALLPF